MERSRATAAKCGLPHAVYSNIQTNLNSQHFSNIQNSRLLTFMQNKIGPFFLRSKGVHVWIDYKSGCMNPGSLLLFGHAALALINTPIKRRLEQRRGKDPLRVCNMSTISLSTKKINREHTLILSIKTSGDMSML